MTQTKIKTEKWVVTDTQEQRRIAVFRFPEGTEELDQKAWEELI